MKYNSIYNNFSSGELSRNLFGRTDLEEYFKGLAEMTNFLPIRQGGATFRPGTICIPAGYSVTSTAIFDFSPRDNERYVVLLQPGRPIVIVTSEGAGTTITQPSYPWNERINFNDATEAYNAPADNAAHRTITDSLQLSASGDVMIVVDGTGVLAPIVIIRTAANTFVVDSFILPQQLNALGVPYLNPPIPPMRVPYKDPNLESGIRLVPSAVSGTITITSEDAAAAAIPFFTGDVVGMFVKITHGGTATGVALITAKASDSSVTAVTYTAFGATTAETNFETSAWNPEDGYPRTLCFFEGRLVFGGNKKFPDTIWCSHTGNIYHFMQRRLAQDASTNVSGFNYFGAIKVTDPFNFIPAAVGANSIQWLYPADSLLVGTITQEFSITGGQEATISVSAILARAISSHGSAKVQPIKAGSSLLFVSADGKRILEIPKRLSEYTSALDWTGLAAGIVEKAVEGVTTTLLSVTPIKSKITKIAWDESTGVLWAICKNSASDDTAVISLTVDRTSKVAGWAKHKIGGTPFVSSLATINDIGNQGSTRVFMMLKRPNSYAYSLESLSFRSMHESHFPSVIYGSGPPMTVYMDGSAFGSTGTPDELGISSDQRSRFGPSSTYGVIKIDGDIGTYLGTYVDTNAGGVGAGTLLIPGIDMTKSYIIGALYEGELKTMPIEAGAQFGVSQGSPRRTHEIVVYVDRSNGGLYKASKTSNLFSIIGSKGTPTALYTGECRLSLNASPDDHQIVIKQTEPYPLTLLWLLTKGYTYDA